MGRGSRNSQTMHQAPGKHRPPDTGSFPGVAFEEEGQTGGCFAMF